MSKQKAHFVFVLAQSLAEAKTLRDAGCGYSTKTEAVKARSSPEIDSYYLNLLQVFRLEASDERD